jgi:hypothetical protein
LDLFATPRFGRSTTDPAKIAQIKTWLGRNKLFYRRSKKHEGLILEEPTKRQQRMIAVAGGIAEACWRCRNSDQDFDCPEDLELDYWSDWDIMSESDWALSGCAPCEPSAPFFTAVEKVIDLLRPNGGVLWPDLICTARRLIDVSRTGQGVISDSTTLISVSSLLSHRERSDLEEARGA